MAKQTITGGVGVLWSTIKTMLNEMFTELYAVVNDGKIKIGDYTSYAKVSIGGASTEMDAHAVEDWTVVDATASPGLAYASFDAKPTISGTSAVNHLVGVQSRPIYDADANLTNYLDSINSAPVHNGAGTIVKHRGLHITDVAGAGPVTDSYGIYVEGIARGATNNYAIYTNSGQVYFGGTPVRAGGVIESDVSGGFYNNLLYSSGWKYRANGGGFSIYSQSGFFKLYTAPVNASGALAAATPALALSIDQATNNVGIKTISAPTARLHLPACAAAANSASLKIDPGTLATTAVSGNIESDGTHLYWTDSGGTRKQLD